MVSIRKNYLIGTPKTKTETHNENGAKLKRGDKN